MQQTGLRDLLPRWAKLRGPRTRCSALRSGVMGSHVEVKELRSGTKCGAGGAEGGTAHGGRDELGRGETFPVLVGTAVPREGHDTSLGVSGYGWLTIAADEVVLRVLGHRWWLVVLTTAVLGSPAFGGLVELDLPGMVPEWGVYIPFWYLAKAVLPKKKRCFVLHPGSSTIVHDTVRRIVHFQRPDGKWVAIRHDGFRDVKRWTQQGYGEGSMLQALRGSYGERFAAERPYRNGVFLRRLFGCWTRFDLRFVMVALLSMALAATVVIGYVLHT